MEEEEAESVAPVKTHNPLLSTWTWAIFQIWNPNIEAVVGSLEKRSLQYHNDYIKKEVPSISPVKLTIKARNSQTFQGVSIQGQSWHWKPETHSVCMPAIRMGTSGARLVNGFLAKVWFEEESLVFQAHPKFIMELIYWEIVVNWALALWNVEWATTVGKTK